MTMRELFEIARAKWPGNSVFVECSARHFSHCPDDPPQIEWRVYVAESGKSAFLGGTPEEVAEKIRGHQTIAMASAACEDLPS